MCISMCNVVSPEFAGVIIEQLKHITSNKDATEYKLLLPKVDFGEGVAQCVAQFGRNKNIFRSLGGPSC